MSRSQSQPSFQSVAVVGTYLPRRCGIAVFSTDLCEALAAAQGPHRRTLGVAVNDLPDGYHYPPCVRFEVVANLPRDYRDAAEFLNMHEVDVVFLQHEFGIYGGPAGSNILRLLRELRVPVIATMHSVLPEPSPEQRTAISQMSPLVDRFVVTSRCAADVLAERYEIDPARIAFVPRGVPDLPRSDPEPHKQDLGLAGHKVILSFGLLSSDKGIEHMVAAMPAVIRRHPEAFYVVLGVTHPRIKAAFGEEYRQKLFHQIRQLGLEDHVTFRSRFVGPDELHQYLWAADVCVTPCNNATRLTSGTLALAMAAGNAVVSTPYPYAQEMLADGRGRLVPFAEPEALAEQVSELLADDRQRAALARKAHRFTRGMTWAKVAARYLEVAHDALLDRGRSGRRTIAPADPMGWSEIVPEIDLRHLRMMTDDVGMAQHAVYAIPDRRHGYCTDDNARALMVAMWYWDLREDPSIRPLISTYLAFLVHAFNEQRGRFRNFMSFSREWLEEVGSEDSHARAIMALGIAAALARYESTLGLCVRLFNDALPAAEHFNAVRPIAFTLVGLDAYLNRFPGDTGVRRTLETLGRRLLAGFEANGSADWPWPEDRLTWGNARVPHGLLVAGSRLDSQPMCRAALRVLDWLLEIQTAPGGHLSVIGNRGWYPRGGPKALWDQQPIELMYLAEACSAAYGVTRDRRWLGEIRRCLEWFLGRNDLGQPLYDFRTGGSRDGLSRSGVNANQGAESTLAWLSTLLTVHRLQVHETLNPATQPAANIELRSHVI